MSTFTRHGIIDIGSNSIRLCVYEKLTLDSYRVIDESKQSARLSERIGQDGIIQDKDISELITILQRFQLLCDAHQVNHIRAVATAAIRNANNTEQVLQKVEDATGIRIDVLSGEEEARMGFLGVVNTMPQKDGFIIDIGGGSTEVTLFSNRNVVKSISFPFGAVNTTKWFSSNGIMSEEQLRKLEEMIDQAVQREEWIRSAPNLPCIGVGGTFRTISKVDQRELDYPFHMTHHYQLVPSRVAEWIRTLMPVDAEQRKKKYQISKDRADLIVPGMAIANRLMQHMRSSQLLISGAGLRDGLFFSTVLNIQEPIRDIVEYSIKNTLTMHPEVSIKHVQHVNRLALRLFDDLKPMHNLDERERMYLNVASLLYRIGVSIQFYEYHKHTFYLIAHARISGLTHREMLICALIAAFKSKSRVRELYNPYRNLLLETDLQLIVQLGTILRLAISLDRSETQPVQDVRMQVFHKDLELTIYTVREPTIERLEWSINQKEIQKLFKLQFSIRTIDVTPESIG